MENLAAKMQNLQRNCTNADGIFNKESFMFLVAVFFCLDQEKNGFVFDVYKDMNRYLYRILGKGNNIGSCLQFVQGKRGRRIAEASAARKKYYDEWVIGRKLIFLN